MYKRWVGLAVLATAFAMSSVPSQADARVIRDVNSTRNYGSAQTDCSYVVYDRGQEIELHIDLRVKKRGMIGTGKGTCQYLLYGANGKVLFSERAHLTVGAKAPEGINDKRSLRKFRIPKHVYNQRVAEGIFIAGHDQLLSPPTVGQIAAIVKALASGEERDIGGGTFLRGA